MVSKASKSDILFEESEIQSVRTISNVEGLYYQNDIKSQHDVQKYIQEYKKRDVATVIKNLQQLSKMQRKLELCMVLEIILLQDHIKDFVNKALSGIAGMKIEGKITFKNLEALPLGKSSYSPNQGTVEESLDIRNVQSVLSQM